MIAREEFSACAQEKERIESFGSGDSYLTPHGFVHYASKDRDAKSQMDGMVHCQFIQR